MDKVSMKSALIKSKEGKASGASGVVTEIVLASGDADLERMTSLFNCVLKEKRIPFECGEREL